MSETTTTEPRTQCPQTMLVRYGAMNMVGEVRNLPGQRPLCGSKIVIQSERGMEIAEVLSLSCENCARAVPRPKVVRYVQASGPENCKMDAGKMLRVATGADLAEAEHITRNSLEMKHYCQQRADELKLPMRVVGVEHVFGGERAIFYFQSEERIDFRALVKDLAQQYQTRIEMRQIGARDEARLLADYEICGRECCCRSFLKNLKPVNMRMAKTQKATLDPTKVSGRCGRLRCCLRYESQTYEELERNLPAANSRVRTEQGVGRVVDRQVITQMLILIMEVENVRVAVPLEAVLERNVKTPPPEPRPDVPEGRGRPDRRGGRPAGPPRGERRPLRDEINPPPAAVAPTDGPTDGPTDARPNDRPGGDAPVGQSADAGPGPRATGDRPGGPRNNARPGRGPAPQNAGGQPGGGPQNADGQPAGQDGRRGRRRNRRRRNRGGRGSGGGNAGGNGSGGPPDSAGPGPGNSPPPSTNV